MEILILVDIVVEERERREVKSEYRLILILGCALFLSFGVQTTHSGDQSAIPVPTQNETMVTPPVTYIPHDPILIDDNGDFGTLRILGDGSKNHPWIIENYVFENASHPSTHLIHIQDTTDFFVIRNCYFDGVMIDWDCINLVNVRNGEIKNNTIGNGFHGITLEFSHNNNITENDISFNEVGLLLSSSNENRIDGNYLSDNDAFGIEINTGSSDNAVINNDVYLNDAGIVLWGGASNNQIVTNEVFTNQYEGIGLHSADCNNISDNHVFENGGGIAYEYSHFNIITWNEINNNDVEGIGLAYDTNTLIANNTIYENCMGIQVIDHSDDNTIVNNGIFSNYEGGVYLSNVGKNKITDNVIRDSQRGIWLNESDENVIRDNTCTTHLLPISSHGYSFVYVYGFFLDASDNNTLSGNTVSILVSSSDEVSGNNYVDGFAFYLGYSDDNTLSENVISSNWNGISMSHSSRNLVFHNCIAVDIIEAEDLDSMYGNYWYHPILLEGNYWSKYIGVDLDGDGIGDTEVPWPDIGYDLYPLVSSAVNADGDALSDGAERIIDAVLNSANPNPLTPTSPQEATEAVYSSLQNLVNCRDSGGNDALKRKADAANALMDRGNWFAAARKLSGFID